MVTISFAIAGIIGCLIARCLTSRSQASTSFWSQYGLFVMAIAIMGWAEYQWHYNPDVVYERALLLESKEKKGEATRLLTYLAEELDYDKAQLKLMELNSSRTMAEKK